jgi:cyclin-dependent kinase
VIKIIDFGLARASGIPVKNYTNEVVTLWYRPPDVLMGNQSYTFTIDIWSIGCIFAEMVNNKPLFMGKNDEDQLKKIFRVMGSPNLDEWEEAGDLPDFTKYKYSISDPMDMQEVVPRLDECGLDLLIVTYLAFLAV